MGVYFFGDAAWPAWVDDVEGSERD